MDYYACYNYVIFSHSTYYPGTCIKDNSYEVASDARDAIRGCFRLLIPVLYRKSGHSSPIGCTPYVGTHGIYTWRWFGDDRIT